MKTHIMQRVRATGALLAVVASIMLTVSLISATGISPVWVNLTAYLVFVPAALLIRRSRWFTSRWNTTPTTPIVADRDLRPIGSYGFLVCTGIALAMTLATALYAARPEQTTSTHQYTAIELLAMFLMQISIGPYVEELLTRGLIYPVLRRGFGITASAVVSSLLFAFAHADATRGVYTFFLGLTLALVYETSHSLKDVVIIHLMHNVIGVMVLSGVHLGTWIPVPTAQTCAIIVWLMTLIGIYEYVTMTNDVRGGYRAGSSGMNDGKSKNK